MPHHEYGSGSFGSDSRPLQAVHRKEEHQSNTTQPVLVGSYIHISKEDRLHSPTTDFDLAMLAAQQTHNLSQPYKLLI
jgi:hypothetical protein